MKASITKKLILLVFTMLGTGQKLCADTRLMLYFTHLPQSELVLIKQTLQADQVQNPLQTADAQTPAELANLQLENIFKQFLTPKLSGFPVLYGGYVTVTDPDGLAMFPLRHSQPKLYIAVTPDIKLIHVKGTSFSHAEYTAHGTAPLALYKCERLEDEKQKPFWKITKIQKPDNNRINPLTIVILSHPDNIYVAEADSMASAGEQFVVPPIRVIGNQDKELVNLRLLDIKPYFEQVKTEKKRVNDTTIQKITTTF